MDDSNVKIICAGLPKTGTKTFAAAMEILGFRHRTRDALARSAYLYGYELSGLLRHVDSVDDFPWPLVLDQINYPMKVVLTLRESPERWVQSAHGRIEKKGKPRPGSIWYEQFCRDGDLKPDDELKSQYVEHTKYVRAFCGEHDIPLQEMCWEEGDGWETLCNFLGVNYPDAPFPHENPR